MRRRSRVGRREAGMVSAELATALAALAVVLTLVLGAVAAGIDLVRVTDAARVGARAAARGDDPARVQAAAAASAPQGAQVLVERSGDEVAVTVSSPVPGVLGALVPGPLRSRAVAPAEAGGA